MRDKEASPHQMACARVNLLQAPPMILVIPPELAKVHRKIKSTSYSIRRGFPGLATQLQPPFTTPQLNALGNWTGRTQCNEASMPAHYSHSNEAMSFVVKWVCMNALRVSQ